MKSVADKAYRFTWNGRRGLALKRMPETKTNNCQIRNELGITSMRSKIEEGTGTDWTRTAHAQNQDSEKNRIRT